jgi:hypothetical protein
MNLHSYTLKIKREVSGMNYSKIDFERMMDENGGSLDISKTRITQLPDKLTVRGDLILNRYITKLPNELTVEGNLDLRNTMVDLKDIQFLTIHGNLYTGPYTEYLSEPIVIDGDLDLRASGELKEIWQDHFVLSKGLYLDCNNKYIKSLPENMALTDLMLNGSHVEFLPESRIISGNVDLGNSAIKRLPDNFVVYGNLNLANTSLSDYPEKMVVFGNLDIRGTKLPAKHDGIVVVGEVIVDTKHKGWIKA